VRRGSFARLVGLGLLAAAPALGARPVELDIPVFAGGYGTAFYEDAARRFETLRPWVRVHVYGDPRIQDQVRIRVIDGNLPDAAWVPYILWPSLIRSGKVVDLRPELAGPNWEGDGRWGDTFQPGSLDSWRIDGGVYGLPFGYSCWSIFYNRGAPSTLSNPGHGRIQGSSGARSSSGA
jgi:ABC-type glycerol-3-phosphate transport system substrate-binding protein